MANRNKLLVPGVEDQLRKMKNEIAAEFGIENYDSLDKGELSARTNGKIGGEMVRRLIEIGKKALVESGMNKAEVIPIKPEIRKVDFVQKRMNA